MSDIKVTFKLDAKSAAFLKRFPERFKESYRKGMVLAMNFAEAKAKTSFGQEGKPGVKTGTLRRSISSLVFKRADDFIGVLYSNMIYARIHELGGDITPVRARFLKYNLKGKTIYSKKSRIPARPYIRPALEENIDSLSKIIAKELIRSV